MEVGCWVAMLLRILVASTEDNSWVPIDVDGYLQTAKLNSESPLCRPCHSAEMRPRCLQSSASAVRQSPAVLRAPTIASDDSQWLLSMTLAVARHLAYVGGADCCKSLDNQTTHT